MKILVAKFQLEANEHVDMKCDLPNVALSYGRDALSHMQVGDVFDDLGTELVPVICADAACSGVMKKTCFDYIEQTILNAVRDNLRDLDGIYLHLHGASYVEEIGSGEHHLVAAIRQIVGPYLPLAVELIRHRQNITPVYRKLPLILGGEQSVSADEPVRSFNQYMDEMEKDPRILSASWHVGYLRHDCPEAGCGVVVIPATGDDHAYAEQKADELAAYVWGKRHEFHYTGTTAQPDEALRMALNCPDKPSFITDSGDNVTSGAQGANTFILRQVLAVPDLHKKVLFAAIHDAKLCHALLSLPIDTVTNASVGMGFDSLSAPVSLTLRVLYKGIQEGTHMYGEDGSYGPLVTVAVEGTPLVLTITDNNHSFVEEHQLDACGVDWKNFDIIVVKQGYIHPELKAAGALCVMSLTDGATPQDTRLIPFKRIMRPMFPIDNI